MTRCTQKLCQFLIIGDTGADTCSDKLLTGSGQTRDFFGRKLDAH